MACTGSSRQAFKALEDIRDQFAAQFGSLGERATASDAAAIARAFRPALRRVLDASASQSSSAKIDSVKAGIDRVKSEAMRGIGAW